MTDDDDFELIRGTGNVYADLGMKEPEQRQLRAILGDMGAAILDALAAHQTALRILTVLWVIAAIVATLWTVTP